MRVEATVEDPTPRLVFRLRPDEDGGIDLVAIDPDGDEWEILNIAPSLDSGRLELYRFTDVPQTFFETEPDSYRIAEER